MEETVGQVVGKLVLVGALGMGGPGAWSGSRVLWAWVVVDGVAEELQGSRLGMR
ncbi:hypothetical protein [Kribbella sp. CA-294648]|uniref:hypothetical protein n=1 Tax=Kribbella sp. CA-294648 TaxID=3239948 RepID=UPI003D9268C1